MAVVYKVGDTFVDPDGNPADAPKDADATAPEQAANPQDAAPDAKPAKRTIQAPKDDK